LTRLNKKWYGLTAGLLLLPIVAACDPNTAQAPTQTAPTEASPGVAEAPTTAPTTTAPTAGDQSIVDLAATDDSLSTFNTAVEAAGLAETLSGPGPYTVFAPSNEAFEAIPEETRQTLLQPENQEQLRQVLSYHVVEGNLPSTQLQSGEVDTVAGQPLNVQVDQGTQQVNVNDANVTQPNLQANNGVVHIVDRVIIPPNLTL
jgi:uncharacterized surface protein with fasciclin (FAS1) repeats